MKKQLIVTTAALLFGAVACKKNETTPPLQQQGLEANTPSNVVQQKTYDLNYIQTNAVVTSFKNQFNSLAFNKNTNNNVTLALDSSIWILEAALNSDFDSDKGDNEVYHDSLSITSPINNGAITAFDINKVYSDLKNSINQVLSTDKAIELIDVSAKILDNTIKYQLDIVLFNKGNSFKKGPPFTLACDPFYTETAAPSRLAPVMPNIYNHFLACSGLPALDAPTIIMGKLNNCGLTLCAFGYFTNIVDKNFYGYDYPSTLYYRNGLLPADFCLTSNLIVGTAQLNTYRTNIKTLAIANIPASPANMTVRNYSISYREDFTLCGCGANQKFSPVWALKVKYAVLVCP